MIYLALSVLCSTLIFVIFKLFERYKVTNLYAIMANYSVAATLGYIVAEERTPPAQILHATWFMPTIGIGFLFIALFQIMAYAAQKMGVSRVSIAVKMSLVLPVLAGVWFYGERLSVLVICGILLALLAVYLGTKKNGDAQKQTHSNKMLVFLPLVLFMGNGSIDILMKYAQQYWLKPTELAMFSGVLFVVAFLWGIAFAGYEMVVNRVYPTGKDLLAGFILGIPNFGSIYFLLHALDRSNMPSAAIYPINNVSIVALSALGGVLIFKEKLSRINLIGLLFAIAAILLIAYG